MALQHFSHEHPLMLMEERENDGEKKVIVCSGCEESVLPLEYPYYQCSSHCNFVLHKSCAELPHEKKHPLHPNHPLILQAPSLSRFCDACRKVCDKCFFYECKPCEFDLDIKCASVWQTSIDDCQQHALIPIVEMQHPLHKSCAQLPHEMQHSLHPNHPLILQAPRPTVYCNVCGKQNGKCFFYRCDLCDFDIDIKCASPWQISIDDCQRHAFNIILNKQIQFTCEACGEEGKDNTCLCSICRVLLHPRCALFSRTIQLRTHNHSLTLTYSLQDQVKESDNLFCRLCRKRVNIKYAAYYCKEECNYVVHSTCGSYIADRSGDIRKKNLEVQTYKGDREINHFSHHHKLKLITDTDTEEELKDDQYCEGCRRQIWAPFYSCAPCNFFIHLRCAELPSQMQHPSHPHELTLWPTLSLFRCSLCERYCSGLMYDSNFCRNKSNYYFIDAQCCSTPETLTHEGHEHPLFLAQKVESDYEKCSACDDLKDIGKFVCTNCNFTLGYRCATLPLVVRHMDHCRLLTLTLTYEAEDNSGKYYCLICEEERDPKRWFYYSADCDFAAHTQCVLGKYPYIKFGSSYKKDFHQHPITLIQKDEHNPPCKACNEPFVGLAFECARCNFNIHREGDCYVKLVREGRAI